MNDVVLYELKKNFFIFFEIRFNKKRNYFLRNNNNS